MIVVLGATVFYKDLRDENPAATPLFITAKITTGSIASFLNSFGIKIDTTSSILIGEKTTKPVHAFIDICGITINNRHRPFIIRNS